MAALEPLVEPEAERELAGECEGLGEADVVVERDGEPEAVKVLAEVRERCADALGGTLASAVALGNGERLPVALPEAQALGRGERDEEMLLAPEAVIFVLPLGTLVRLLEALMALLADTEGVVLPLALARALAEPEIEGGREAVCVALPPPLGVAGPLRLTTGLGVTVLVAATDAVPFATEPVTDAVMSPVAEGLIVAANESVEQRVMAADGEAATLAQALLLADGVPPICVELGAAVCEEQLLARADAVTAEAEPLNVTQAL